MSTTYEEFVNQVKKTILSQPIPPRYKPREWRGKKFNCYAYAIQACMNLSGRDIWPGFIFNGKENDYQDTKDCVLDYFKKDCEALGLQAFPTTIKEKISKTEYKIAVYIKEGDDFHFARQDSNGKWSEKDGWTGRIRKIDEEYVDENIEGYEFIGVFRLSKKAG